MKIVIHLKRSVMAIGVFLMLTVTNPLPVHAVAAPVTPVFDFNALINSIKEFASTVQYYQQMTQQIKREYEKMKKAAEMISTGEFNKVMQGCMNIANQAAGWGITGDYADQLLSDVGGFFENTLSMQGAYTNLRDNFSKSWDSISSAWNSIGSGGDSWLTGSLDLLSGIGDLALDTADFAERFTGDLQAAVAPINDLVFVWEGGLYDAQNVQLNKLKEKKQNLEDQLYDLKQKRQEAISNQESNKEESYTNLIEDVRQAISTVEADITALQDKIEETKTAMTEKGQGQLVEIVNNALNQLEAWQMDQLRFSASLYRSGLLNSMVNSVPYMPKEYKFDTSSLKKAAKKVEEDGYVYKSVKNKAGTKENSSER